VGRLNFEMARRRIPRMVTVSEEQILHAMYLLMSRANLWAEGAAASALAAARKEREDLRGKKVALILTGGHVDAAVIRQVFVRHACKQGSGLFPAAFQRPPNAMGKVGGYARSASEGRLKTGEFR